MSADPGGSAAADRGSSTAVHVEIADAIATVTLNRPETLNALTLPMRVELARAFRSISRDRSVRAVILTGSGRGFCAGQDLKERLEPDAAPLAVEVRERYNPIIRAMFSMDQPIVAAVNGVAAGAGASLAFAGDIRVASDSASFVLAFGRIGLVPDSGATWMLPRLVGPSKAAELALLGGSLSAVDAERWGLVSRVVGAHELAGVARETAERLAALAPRALALTKRALQRSWSVDVDAALDDEAWRQGIAGATADHAEGIAAFLEKRPPRFTGE